MQFACAASLAFNLSCFSTFVMLHLRLWHTIFCVFMVEILTKVN